MQHEAVCVAATVALYCQHACLPGISRAISRGRAARVAGPMSYQASCHSSATVPLRCRLRKLPDALAALTALVRLECSDNSTLTALPAALGAAQRSLGAVLAERCGLRTFPSGLARAAGLRVLSLATNALTDIPADAFAGPHLLPAIPPPQFPSALLLGRVASLDTLAI